MFCFPEYLRKGKWKKKQSLELKNILYVYEYHPTTSTSFSSDLVMGIYERVAARESISLLACIGHELLSYGIMWGIIRKTHTLLSVNFFWF